MFDGFFFSICWFLEGLNDRHDFECPIRPRPVIEPFSMKGNPTVKSTLATVIEPQ